MDELHTHILLVVTKGLHLLALQLVHGRIALTHSAIVEKKGLHLLALQFVHGPVAHTLL